MQCADLATSTSVETLDLALARDTAEGLDRYRSGTKPPSEVTNFRSRALAMYYHGDGDFAHVPLSPVYHDQAREIQVRPQDGALLTGSEVESQSSSRQPTSSWRDGEAAQKWTRRRAFDCLEVTVPSGASKRALRRTRASDFDDGDRRAAVNDSESIEVLHETSTTSEIRRAVAKIAFNYLTYVEGTAYALQRAFDPVRNFIGPGTEPALGPVHIG